MTTHEFFESIDGPLFREQREVIAYLIDESITDSPEQNLLLGIEEMFDAMADILYDQYGKDCLFMEDAE